MKLGMTFGRETSLRMSFLSLEHGSTANSAPKNFGSLTRSFQTSVVKAYSDLVRLRHLEGSKVSLEGRMPELTIEGHGSFQVALGKRLVKAIEENGVDILHRCGGFARCTTCRVEFLKGEPQLRTVAERDKLREKGESGIRLSCQCLVEGDMSVRVINTLQSTGLDSPGDEPKDNITPDPEWISLTE
jgi:ferredoxin